MASFRTLDDLRKGEEGDKKENEYYVGVGTPLIEPQEFFL